MTGRVRSTGKSHPEIVLVPDDAKVVRASELEELMGRCSLREAAEELGIAVSNLHRFLRANGYETQSTWRRTAPPAQEAAK